MSYIELSIIIPIYNVEEYLEECLNSVYPLKISKEIILVNDGSTDNSLKIAEKYNEKYPNETILISQENRGLSGARNTGLKVATGKYIYFLDSDDFINTENFEIFLKEIDEDANIVNSQLYYHYISPLDRQVNKNLKTKSALLETKNLFKGFNDIYFIPAVWLNIYKRDFLTKENLQFKEGLLYEDYHFSYFAFLKAKKIKIMNIPFLNYRQRSSSIMAKPINYLHMLFIVNSFLDYNLKYNINSHESWYFVFKTFKRIVKQAKVYNFEIYKKLWKMKGKRLKGILKLLKITIKLIFIKNIHYDDIKNIKHK